MGKIKILLADTDEVYVQAIETRIIEEFARFVEIHIITDINYFNEFFSNAQNFDIVIINENLYNEKLYKHSFKEIYILMENIDEEGKEENLNIRKLYKYIGVKEIIGRIMRGEVLRKNKEYLLDNSTKVITVYSPQGGAGTTTISLSISSIAAKGMRKVLFFAIDNLQNFTWLLDGNITFPASLEKKLMKISEYSYGEIRSAISKSEFDYIPPFRQAISVLDISTSNLINLIGEIKKSNEYDYIIVDTSADFNKETPHLMGISDKVVIVTQQDEVSAKKLGRLLLNIDISDDAKFSVLCNKYRPDRENYIVNDENLNGLHISHYIEYIDKIRDGDLNECIKNQQIQQAAYLYIQ